MRAGEKIVVQFADLGAKRIERGGLLAEIEAAAVGIVEENSVGRAVKQGKEERNCLVQRVCGFPPTDRIGVPHCESLIAAVERPGLVAETEIELVRRHGLPDADFGTVPGHPTAGSILGKHVVRQVEKSNAQWRLGDAHLDPRRYKLNVLFRLLNRDAQRHNARWHDGPREIPREFTIRRKTHAYYGVADGSDAHSCRAGLQLHAVRQNFDMRDLAEVMPFRASPHRAQRNAAEKHSQKNSRMSCHTRFPSQAGGAAPVNYGDSLGSTIRSFAAAMMSAKLRKTRALSRLLDAAARRPARRSARKDPHRKIQASKARAARPVRVPVRSLGRERGKTLAETLRAEPFRAAVHARALLQVPPARGSHFRRWSFPPHPARARIRTSRAFHSRHPARTSASALSRRSRFPRGKAGTERTHRQRNAAHRFSAA